MKKRFYGVWVILLLLVAGCAQHFYRVGNGQVHLYLEAPEAESVYFLSSLDGFKPQAISKTPRGKWMVSLPGVREFRYFYLVDGQVYHPPCRYREADDFGAFNCIFSPDM
ncbi:MAG: hypothetical protein JEZ12_14575 [Desulfobacterium sp.]|nr:hypothetical protein [Desulfobacterium sp.]